MSSMLRSVMRWLSGDANGFKDTVIMAGTGAQSTKETIKLCKDAAEAGADFALTLTPSTWPKQMTQANVVRFFHTVRSIPERARNSGLTIY